MGDSALDERPGGLDPRQRAARLGWLTAALVLVAVLLVIVEVWLLVTGEAGRPRRAVLLPLDLDIGRSRIVAYVAAAILTTATIAGLAALHTAAAMQVLNRHREVPRPLPMPLHPPGRTPWERGLLRTIGAVTTPLPTVHEALAPATDTVLRCTVLVPAHDEEAVLGATLTSLTEQTRPPDRVIVIADNCTDDTAGVAGAHGTEVVETVGNTEKKAGALNQVLERLLPELTPDDVVMVMDADSTISPEFLEVALGLLEEDTDLMAVGGLFYGEDGGGLVGQLQRNEYTRYQRIVARKLGRVFVLTGTASIIRGYALRAVADARGLLIPGPPGRVYDTLALTEDNELTLALKTLGARMTSPPQCRVTTEVMTRWKDLWRQRLRWHRGALENIGAYGLTRATAMYWTQQLALGYGVVALWSYLALMFITLLAADSIRWSPFWVTIGLVFVVERLVTAWAAGWRGRVVAAPIFIELAYAVFLQCCFVVSLVQIATGRKAGWNYVPRPAMQGVAVPALVALPYGVLLPATVLTEQWYQALATWVGFNTLVFAVLSVIHLLPPRRRRRPARTIATPAPR